MNKFFTPKRIVTKGLLFVALFGTFALGSVLMTAHQTPVALAHAGGGSCSVATAMSDLVSDTNPQVGETITYTLQGAPALTASTTITVTDQLGSGLTFVSANPSVGTYVSSTGAWNVGTLNGISNITLTLTATVNAGTEGQTINNAPSINYVESNCTQSSAVGSAPITVQSAAIITPTSTPTSTTPSADISIAKTANVTSTVSGGAVVYTIVVTDNGPATSTGVMATDTLPSGMTFVSATTSEGSYSSSTGSWGIGTLSNGQSATLMITATANTVIASTTVTNTATVVEYGETDLNTANDSSSVSICVEPCPPVPCSLSAGQFETDVNNGTITVGSVNVNNASGTASFTITNGTQCTAPISLASYKMFVAAGSPGWLSTQQLFDSTSTSALPASSTTTFVVNVAPCMTQVDSYFGQAPATLLDSNPYSYPNVPFVLSWAFSNGALCAITPTSTPVANLSIVKTVDNASPTPGATINYTLTVDAQGPASSTGVVATDTLPSGLTFVNATTSASTTYASSTGMWTIGTLAPNATATLEIAALVNASDTIGQQITNTGIVGESTSTTNNTGNTSSSVTVTVTSPVCTSNCGGGAIDADIAIAKTADVTSTAPGDTVHYTLTATALGPNPSTNVVATDTLPSGLTFVNATTSASTTYDSGAGTWTIGTLAPNATATLEIAALVNASDTAGTITNIATIGEAPTLTDTNTGNNTASSSVQVVTTSTPSTDADMSVVKIADNLSPTAGSIVNFTVTMTDGGPATSTFVHVQDPLQSGLDYVSSTVSQGSYDMTTGDWNIGTVSPNATATLVVTTEVDPTAAVGQQVANTATVYSTLASLVDPNSANNSSTVTLTVQPTGCTSNCGGGGGDGGGGGTSYDNVGILKTVDNSTPATGATINYTLTANNTGPNSAVGVIVNDALPAGLTFVSASSSDGSYVNGTGAWTIGPLNVGETETLTITATVNASSGTSIVNTATISQGLGATDSLPSNNTASTTITVAGGGGGGGGGGGQVLGASTSTGQVLGASCGLYLTQYIHPIRKDLNDPTEVKKLQTFLNQNLGLNIPVTGFYGDQTIAAVNEFQTKYHIEVLKPWVPLGLPTQFTPTSYVYQTTQRWINLIMCPPLNIPLPALKVDNSE